MPLFQRLFGPPDIRKLKKQRNVPALIEALHYRRPLQHNQHVVSTGVGIRASAAWALGEIRDVRAVGPLITLLKDEHDESLIRHNVVWALGQIGDPQAVENLVPLLNNLDWRIRWVTMEALANIGDQRIISELVKLLKDDNYTIRWGAAWALGKMGKNLLELEQARHFARWVTREDLSPIDEPDCTHPSRPGGHPDYIFRDSGGREYILELTRLLAPELRELEQFTIDRICVAVQSGLPGTYILHIRLGDARGRGRIDRTVADSIVQEIIGLVKGGGLGQSHRLRTGFMLTRVRDDGNRLVPWITAPELPYLAIGT